MTALVHPPRSQDLVLQDHRSHRHPRKHRIAFDARSIGASASGIGHVALELLRGFAALDVSLHVLVDGHTQLPEEVAHHEGFRFLETASAHRSVGDQVSLPGLLQRAGIDLLHTLDCFAPLALRKTRLLINIHDVIPLVCPEGCFSGKKASVPIIWRSWLRLQCARACQVITPSRHSREQIVQELGIDREKVCVIANPVRRWHAIEPVAAFRERWNIKGPMISYVGRQEPYKNLVNLVRAFHLVRQRHLDANVTLVVGGNPDPRYPEALREINRLGLAPFVRLTGYLSETELGTLYQSSNVFVFPSYHEGFGLPPLEAMSFGTPVVASCRGFAYEVLGKAAVYVNPTDPTSIADGIGAVLSNCRLAARFSAAGVRRSRRYQSWAAALSYLRAYESALVTA
jgi:glycosyltransferase involved in cell wall biosynthesis